MQFEVPFTIGWLYNLGLTALIKMQSARHMDMLGRKVDLSAVNECWTVRHLQDLWLQQRRRVRCPSFGSPRQLREQAKHPKFALSPCLSAPIKSCLSPCPCLNC